MEPVTEAIVSTTTEASPERPFYEREGWKPMTEEEIARALDSLKGFPDAEMMYLPDFYCKRKGLDFDAENRAPSLKEMLQKPKPVTTKDRLRAKLDERKKLAAESKDGE